MCDTVRVLLVENSRTDADRIVRLLDEAGYQVTAERVEDATSMSIALAGRTWDIIVANDDLPHFDAPAALDVLRQSGLDTPFVAVSGTAGEQAAVSLMRAGARDYLMKDHLARLAPVVEREIRGARERLERQRAEDALRDSRGVIDAILNSIPVRVFWKDRNLEYLGCNSAFARDAGFDKPQDIIGKDDHALVWREQAEYYRSDDRAVIESGAARLLFEEPQTTPSGERIHLLTSKLPLRNAHGEIAGVLGTYFDITDRKRAEDALRESEETYRTLIAGLPDIVMRFDRVGRHLFVSDKVHEVTGLEAGQVIGKTHRELGFPEVQCRFWEEAIRSVFDGDASFETEFTIEADQGPATYNCRLLPEHDPLGRVRSVLTLSRDISAQRRAEENYQMLFREMLDGFALHRILCDKEGRPNDYLFLAVNAAFERMTGLRSQDIVGKTVLEVLPETERCWIEIYGKVALTGEPAFFENYHSGLRKHFRVTAFQPAPGQFACLFADVTDRKLAENALRDSERRHRTILQTAMDGFWCVSLQGRFLDVNHAYCRMSGFQEDELLAMAIADIEAVESPSDVAAHIDRILACGEGRFETRHRRKDGSSFPVEVSVQCKPEFPGQLICFVRDLTQRKRAEEEGRISEERYRLISENTADVIWLLDVDSGRFTYVSPSARRVLGYSPDELVGNGIQFTHTPESCQFATSRLAEMVAAFDSGNGTQIEVQQVDQVHKNGTVIQTEVSATVLANHQGRAKTILGVSRDITERVQTEARLMQAQKLESVGRLAGGVAHDFNNLLTVINGYSNLVLGELLPGDPVRDGIAEIATAGQRAAALTAQLLTLSRKQVVQVKVVNLNEIIVEVARMLARVIGEDIELVSVLSPDVGCVLADPGQIHQLLMNLAVNARDAMPGGGTLRIETTNVHFGKDDLEQHPDRPEASVQLKVIDTGIGMTREVLSHLFEPFFTTKKSGEGTGLGLATVYGIVKQYGGSIEAVSEPGLGTTFCIYLPLVESQPMDRGESKPDLSQLRGTETVLVVEDQEQLRRMVGRVLRSHGYKVHESANAAEALMHAERYSGPIHLLLTDIVMPGMSGRELAGRLKPLRPDMEVLFMSGYCEQDPAAGRLPDGAYLAKPFLPDALVANVRKVLGSPRRAVTILVADDESSVRGLLSKILTGAGYRVLTAGNGKEAIQQTKTATVDLLITDLAMPEQEGIETIATLHRLRPEVKVIAMSGQFGGVLLEAAEHLGADASIAKPIAPDVLLNVVARVLTK